MPFEKTFVGIAPPPAEDEREDRTTVERPQDRTVVEGFGRRAEDATFMERPSPGGTDRVGFTDDMLEELRRRLREAEAREEGSGVRERPTPTPAEGLARPSLPSSPGVEVAPRLDAPAAPEAELELDIDVDLEIEVEEPRTPEELDEVLSALPEIEVALAPNSESNFYAGFDDEHPDGVFVATYRTLRADTPVYVTVHLPAGYRFRTPAIVEWVREPEAAEIGMPAGVGLKMCGLDHRMRRLIRSFAKHRRPIFWVG